MMITNLTAIQMATNQPGIVHRLAYCVEKNTYYNSASFITSLTIAELHLLLSLIKEIDVVSDITKISAEQKNAFEIMNRIVALLNYGEGDAIMTGEIAKVSYMNLLKMLQAQHMMIAGLGVCLYKNFSISAKEDVVFFIPFDKGNKPDFVPEPDIPKLPETTN